MFGKTAVLIRYLLGVQYVLSGFNWWVKVLPFPSLSDPPAPAYKHEIVGAMIHSGWMFGATKAIEFITGAALLANIFVPLMLVVSFPVAFITFILDALIFTSVSGWLMGTVTNEVMLAKVWDAYFLGGMLIVMQAYLMFAYLEHYRPMLAARGAPLSDIGPRLPRAAMQVFGVLAIISGVLALGIMAMMIVQGAR